VVRQVRALPNSLCVWLRDTQLHEAAPLTGTALYVIDMRSFSSIWYRIAIAVLWSTMSQWVLVRLMT
jgi:hypothetical protein